MSKEVRGTVTKLEMRPDGFEVTVTLSVPHLDDLRVGRNLIVTLPEGKPPV